jgi:hypothetical protein
MRSNEAPHPIITPASPYTGRMLIGKGHPVGKSQYGGSVEGEAISMKTDPALEPSAAASGVSL